MGRKKKVSNRKPAVKNVHNHTTPLNWENSLSFDFSYKHWQRGISNRNFVNMLKNEEEYARFTYEIFSIILPTVHANWMEIRKNLKKGQFPHCHTVVSEKIPLIETIIEEIHGKKLLDSSLAEVSNDTFNYWQLGMRGSVRLIAIYSNKKNTMYPVFVDYHHLIHESDKYNETDLDKYPFCPIATYN
jgi:hypothetical protein